MGFLIFRFVHVIHTISHHTVRFQFGRSYPDRLWPCALNHDEDSLSKNKWITSSGVNAYHQPCETLKDTYLDTLSIA